MGKIKEIFLRIRLSWKEFTLYRFPAWWQRVKDHFREDTLNSTIITAMVFVGIPLAIYYGVQFHNYQAGRKAQIEYQEKSAAEQAKHSGIMNIVKKGAVAFLEQQLDKKSESEVKAMFNDSIKWHGKFDEVVAHTEGFKKNSQYQDYLNPIVSDLQTGMTFSAQKTGVKFSDKQVDLTSNDGVLGVMLVLIDSKNPDEIKQALEYQSEKRDYTVNIYDKNTQSGYSLFDGPREQYLFGGDGERTGFGPNNDWIGKIYGFSNSRWVYRSRTLPKILPHKLSNKAFNTEDEKATSRYIKNNQ